MRRYSLTSAVIESLETRALFADMLELSNIAPINAFDGVGFQRNGVAYVTYTKSGKGVGDPSTIKAEVNFGTGWEKADLAKTGTVGTYILKGSHVYKPGANSTYTVTTRVSAGALNDTLVGSTTVNVKALTSPAARGGSLVFPYPQNGAANVQIGITNSTPVTTFAGVGINRNQVATFVPKLNNVADTDITHYFAQINFGDSQTWFNADIARKGTLSSTYVVKNRTHVYAKAGTYKVALVVTGPDGTTFSQESATVNVKNMVAFSAYPIQAAPNGSIGSAVDQWMSVTNSPNFAATKGKSTGQVQLGYLSAKIAGQTNTAASSYQVFINWGDETAWRSGTIGAAVGTTPMKLLGSHTYAKAGTFQVTVHVLGIDGTSLTQESVKVTVK